MVRQPADFKELCPRFRRHSSGRELVRLHPEPMSSQRLNRGAVRRDCLLLNRSRERFEENTSYSYSGYSSSTASPRRGRESEHPIQWGQETRERILSLCFILSPRKIKNEIPTFVPTRYSPRTRLFGALLRQTLWCSTPYEYTAYSAPHVFLESHPKRQVLIFSKGTSRPALRRE